MLLYCCSKKHMHMVTFKAEIQKHQKRSDGTWNVKIRITHNRQMKRLPTQIYVASQDITRSFKIKNQSVIDQANDMINKWRKICNTLDLQYIDMPLDAIIEYIKKHSSDEKKDIDFISFAQTWIDNKLKEGKESTIKNYRTTINAVISCIGRGELSVSEITSKFLTKFAEYLKQQKKLKDEKCIKKGKRVTSDRMSSQYMGCLRHLYNEIKREYNDEENGIILIPWSPFSKFKVPKQEPARKRALNKEVINKIIALDYKVRANARKNVLMNCRYNLARDVFILSFGLIGMNTTDLYSCTDVEYGFLSYCRNKTKNRRPDNALIKVKIQPHIQELIDKYRDITGKRFFNFHHMYCDEHNFNKAVNMGLKEIGKELGVEDLEFYAARHSWATIAANDLKINKYVIHEALNHVDPEMKVTDTYIKKDFSAINEANKTVLDYIYKEAEE